MDAFRIQNLSYYFKNEEIPCLKNITLEIPQGKIISLVGPSGGGKSTFLYCLCGLIPKCFGGLLEGKIKYKNQDIIQSSLEELTKEAQIMFQNPETQFFSQTVREELRYGLESKGLSLDEIETRIEGVLDFFGIKHLEEKTVEELSSGEKQLIILAALVALKPKVLILDEPTANLDYSNSAKLKNLLKKLNKELDMTIIISEHNLDFVKDLSDKIYYFSNGAVEAYSNQFQLNYENNKSNRKNHNIPLLKVENLEFCYNKSKKIGPVSFNLNKGEILGLIGPNGCGKTTIAKCIAGLYKINKGSIYYGGKKLSAKKLLNLTEIGYVYQNPDYSLFENSVLDELVFGPKNIGLTGFIEDAKELLNVLSLDGCGEKDPHNLSIGQKRRVTIASILSMNPKLLILDEPDTGLDRVNSIALCNFLRKLSGSGLSIVLISHNIQLIESICDRVIKLG